MAAISVLVRFPKHSLSAKCPVKIAVAISAFGKVRYLTVFNIDYGNVRVIPSAVRAVVYEDVLAVRTPFERLVSVLVRVVRALEKRFLLTSFRALYDELGAVPQECHPLAVRRYCRLEAGLARGREQALLNVIGECEVLVFFSGQFGLPDTPAAIPFRCIVERAAVLRERNASLLARSIRDSLRDFLLGGHYEHVAVCHDGDFLTIRTYGQSGRSRVYVSVYVFLIVSVGDYLYVHLGRLLCVRGQCVQVSVIREQQGVVRGDGEVSYRMCRKLGNLGSRLRGVDVRLPYVEVTALLAQEIVVESVRREYRITVFARESAQFLVLSLFRKVFPDVSGNGRRVVLT